MKNKVYIGYIIDKSQKDKTIFNNLMLSGIFLLPVATQSHQIKISMNRKQI